MFALHFYFKLFGFDLRIDFYGNFNFTDLLAPWILLIFAAIVSINQVNVCRSCGRLYNSLGFGLLFNLICRFLLCHFDWLCFFLLSNCSFTRFWLSNSFLILLLLFKGLKFLVELLDGFFGESFIVLLLELLEDS